MNIFSKPKVVIFIAIFAVALFLRLYQLEERANFYFDESYDAFQTRRMLVDGKLSLLGHPYSVSGTYQGPVYYYLISLPLVLGGYNPTSVVTSMVVINLLAFIVIGIIAYRFFGGAGALLTLVLYAVSPAILDLSRKSWYPAPIEILAPLCFYLLFISLTKHRIFTVIVAGFLAGLAIEFHFLAITLVIFGLIFLFKAKEKREKIIAFIVGLLVGLSPIILFELKHEFFNTRTAINYFANSTGHTLITYLDQVNSIFYILYSHLFGVNFGVNELFIYFWMVVSFFGLLVIKKRNRPLFHAFLIYITIGVLGAAMFSGEMSFHYIAILHFVPIMLCGYFFGLIFERFKSLRPLAIGFILLVSVFLIREGPLALPLKWGIPQNRKVSQIIAKDIKAGEDFNVVLLDHGESRAWPLRYFLDVYGVKPLRLEDYWKSPFMYVVAQDITIVETIDLWELRGGGPFELEKTWPMDFGYTLFKLHYPHPGIEEKKV